MAKLIPSLILLFCFSALLSSSHARSPTTSSEDESIKVLPATFSEEDVSDLKSLIALPTDNQPGSADSVDLVNAEKNNLEPVKFTGEFQDMPVMIPFDDGVKPINRRFERMRAFRSRHGHRGPRFNGGDQIRPRKMPFGKEESDEEHHHHCHHHHGEIDAPRVHEVDPARFSDVDGEGRMIGEFKEPHFFFRHHHHHHHDEEENDDEDRFHHHHHGEEEEEHHHRHRRGHGFWKTLRKFLGPF